MTILPLVTAPDPRLSICSEEVTQVDDKMRQFMDDMLETMRHHDGIGLAAVQVGVHKRILVMEMEQEGILQQFFVVNPTIIATSEEENIYEEGCLSFPDQKAMVSRPRSITVHYLNYQGEEQVMECSGLLATCIQHEMDHLNGVVFIDHVSKMKRDMILRKVKKIKKKQSS